MYDLAIKNGSVRYQGMFRDLNVYVEDGLIALVSKDDFSARETLDAKERLVIPGLIDPHVHFAMNAGLATSADSFQTGTRAAAFGGVTTVIDFLDEASTGDEVHARFRERSALTAGATIDYSFHAAAKDPLPDAGDVADAALSLGMPTIKMYTTYKPNSYSSPDAVARMVERSAKGDIVVLVHAENDDIIDHKDKVLSHHAVNRPVASEIAAVLEVAAYTSRYQGYASIVHVNAGSTVELLNRLYKPLLHRHLFLEGCPHYFYFSDEVYAGSDAWRYTMTPPLRPEDERLRLNALFQSIDTFATDHCPFLSAEKDQEDLKSIPMGIGGVEYAFPLLYKLFGDDVIDRFTINTARLHGLYPQKGVIEAGSDADIVLLKKTSGVIPDKGESACDYSIYAGLPTDIKVESVLLGGQFVINRGMFIPQRGMFLKRKRTDVFSEKQTSGRGEKKHD